MNVSFQKSQHCTFFASGALEDHEGIAHCFDLDLRIGDGCVEDHTTDVAEAMIQMLVGGQ